MKSNGELVKEAVDFMERGLFNEAFAFVCAALETTIKKSLDVEDVSLPHCKQFINEHWNLISFMCLPNVKSQYLEKRFMIREISLNPHRDFTIGEIVIFLITQTARNRKLPDNITFFAGNDFDKKSEKLLVPSTLVGGLLGLVIVHPVNENETVPDEYWINISDFKMFISELWGRIDLAERIVKFYREN